MIVVYYYMSGTLNKKTFESFEDLTDFIKSNLMIQIDLILKNDKKVNYNINVNIEYKED